MINLVSSIQNPKMIRNLKKFSNISLSLQFATISELN